MPLKSINPTKTKSWSKLKNHFNDISDIHIYDFFTNDVNRADTLSIDWNDFHVDFSKNKINQETINLFNNFFSNYLSLVL